MDKKMSRSKMVLILVMVALVVLLVFSAVQIADSLMNQQEADEWSHDSSVIIQDGVRYYPRQDQVVILVAGIDETGPVQNSGSYNNSGEADMVTLVIFDKKTEKIDMLALNRDAMVDMPVLGVDGKKAGTAYGQLALAHTYGTGLKDSAENLKTTVSNLLYGLDIDYYVTMNMDAIALLNDAVGGVTVNVEDDFSQVDASIGQGSVKLTGQQAVSFLRSRQDVGDQLNLSRMKRQEQYMSAFVTELRRCMEQDSNFTSKVFEELDPYMVTSLSSNALLGLVRYYSHYEMGQMYNLKGENKVVTEFMEYHLDEKALNQQILKLFYKAK